MRLESKQQCTKAFRHLVYTGMTQTITVDGMSCGHCEESVEEALTALEGVTTVTADHETDTVRVDGDSSVEDLYTAIEDAGYEPVQ